MTGWLEYHLTSSPPEGIPFQERSYPPSSSMEPTKVQSEGGLNVTLTIRLLMHGKVGRSFILAVVMGEKYGDYFFRGLKLS